VVTAFIEHSVEYAFFMKADNPDPQRLTSGQVADQAQAARHAEIELLRQDAELSRLRLQLEHAKKRVIEADANLINEQCENEAAISALRRHFTSKQATDQINFQAKMAEHRKEAGEAATRLTQARARVEDELARREREITALRQESEEAKKKCRQAEDKLAEHLSSRVQTGSYPRRYYERVTKNGGELIPKD
jgi:hypothetical protein